MKLISEALCLCLRCQFQARAQVLGALVVTVNYGWICELWPELTPRSDMMRLHHTLASLFVDLL
jgi:hypothetical protein